MQKVPLFYILGFQLILIQIKVNGPQLILPNPLTLTGLQKILGEMNWVKPWLSIETGRLYDLLKGKQSYEIISLLPESHQTTH